MLIPQLRTNWKLSQWQAYLAKIYADKNSQRDILEVYAHVSEMGSGLARGIRSADQKMLEKFVPRFLAWLLGLATRLDIDLETAVYDTYPGVCKYCRAYEACNCKVAGKPKESIRDSDEIAALQEKYPMPENLLEWVGMFARIYGHINKMVGNAQLLGHFFEEFGELCEVIRFHRVTDENLKQWGIHVNRDFIQGQLVQELADLFAWYCGLVYVVGVDIDYNMKSLYDIGCPDCLKIVCQCDPQLIHPTIRLGSPHLS